MNLKSAPLNIYRRLNLTGEAHMPEICHTIANSLASVLREVICQVPIASCLVRTVSSDIGSPSPLRGNSESMFCYITVKTKCRTVYQATREEVMQTNAPLTLALRWIVCSK
jgi:hypothetical protein